MDGLASRFFAGGERAAVVRVMLLALVRWTALTVAVVTLAGCGAEVAGTAATVAATQAAQASQAQAQEVKIIEGFKQAQEGAVDRAASAADEAGK